MEGFDSRRLRTTQQRRSITELPNLVIAKILGHLGASSAIEVFKCKSLCKTFKREGESDEVYKQMEVDRLSSSRFWSKKNEFFDKCREKGNPNIMFRDAMMKLFYLEEEAAGKEMLQQASSLGQRDAKFVLGMLLMAEGKERKEEAMNLLNDEYSRSRRTWDVKQTVYKVREILSRDQYLNRREFPSCLLTCTEHRSSKEKLTMGFRFSYKWLFACKVCLWDACYIIFKDIWDR